MRRLHERLAAAEALLGLPSRPVSGLSDTSNLLADLALLGRRYKAVLLGRAQSEAPASAGPREGWSVPAPPAAAGSDALADNGWPAAISFAATGKVTYQPYGEWLVGPKYRSSWGPDFLQHGYQGDVSISLRARDLERELKTADLRVVLSLSGAFAPRGEGYRVATVTWKAEQSLWNAALKTWPRHDRWSVQGPYRWVSEPKTVSESVEVQAHLLSATTKDGTAIAFRAPAFQPAR